MSREVPENLFHRALLHREFGAEIFNIAENRCNSEYASFALVSQQAIHQFDIAIDRNLIPLLSMTDVIDRDVVMLAPEEWHRVESSLSPSMLHAATWPWRSAIAQCSTRMLPPECGSGQRAISPAA